MGAKTKSLLFQFVSFAIFFLGARYLVATYTGLTGFWIPATSALVAMLLAPQFKVMQTKEGDKILMRWIFLKGVKTLK